MWLFVLFRLGMLAFLVMTTTTLLLTMALPTLDVASWYGSGIVAGLALFMGIAAHAFYRCVAWKGGLAEAMSGD